MVVWGGDGLGMVIKQARHEGAEDEPWPIEGLVNGRGLVDAAGNRLEIANVEGKRPQMPIPPHDIERVVGVGEPGDDVAGFDVDMVLPPFIIGDEFIRGRMSRSQ